MAADNKDAGGTAVMPPQPDETDAPDELDLEIPGPLARGAAVLILLVGVVALAIHTRSYSEEAREFPLLTLAVMAGLLVFQGVLLLNQMRRRSRRTRKGPSPWRKELQITGWIVLLGATVAVLGLMVGVVVFLTLYLVAVRAARLRNIAVIVVLVPAGLYGLFVVFLQVRLPEGLLL